MHNVGCPSIFCLALVLVPLLATVVVSNPYPSYLEEASELPDKRGWGSNFHSGYGKRAWNSFASGYGKRGAYYDYVSYNPHHAEVTDFGYPRACRFRKYQIENRYPDRGAYSTNFFQNVI
jgi:hypothetical protein